MYIRAVYFYSKKRQRYNLILFSAAAYKAAALFVSTLFYFFSQFSLKKTIFAVFQHKSLFYYAPVIQWVRIFVYKSGEQFSKSARCRSPPLILILLIT